jgi:phosphatidylglycerol:prolipoprotein diacylglycerol transferase
MLPYLNLGGLALPVPQLLLLAGVYMGLNQLERFAERFKVRGEALYTLAFTGLLAGFIGARLAYVVRFPNAFLQNPLNILSLNGGLFDLPGGLAVGLIAALIYAQRKRMPLWPTLDALTPALAVFLVFLPLSNLAAGNAYGAPANLPWSIELWGALRHPTQVYEFLAAAAILLALWPSRQTADKPAGVYFLAFLLLSAGARLFFEAFHGDSLSLIWQFRDAQVVSFGLLAGALFLYLKRMQSAEGDNN